MVICCYIPGVSIAVERKRRPELQGVPLALVNENNELAALSDEAATFGIQRFHKLSGAQTLCPNLTVLPYDTPSYEAATEPLWNLLAQESSLVEPISPELCYLEIRDSDSEVRTQAVAYQLTASSLAPVFIGGGRTKIVARLAALTAKQAVTIIAVGDEAKFLARIPVTEALRLDTKTLASLTKLNLTTLGDALKVALHKFPKNLRAIGYELRGLAVGDDGDPVKATWPKTSITERTTFDYDVTDQQSLMEVLAISCKALAGTLNRSGQVTRKIAVSLVLSDGKTVEAERELKDGTARFDELMRAACGLLASCILDEPVTSLALTLSELSRGSGVQLTLLDARLLGELYPHELDRELASSLGFIRRRYGAEAIKEAERMCTKSARNLWVYPLGALLDDPIFVEVDAEGVPVRYHRNGRIVCVAAVLEQWKESQWSWGNTLGSIRYRVLTEAGGVYELEHSGSDWRVTAAVD